MISRQPRNASVLVITKWTVSTRSATVRRKSSSPRVNGADASTTNSRAAAAAAASAASSACAATSPPTPGVSTRVIHVVSSELTPTSIHRGDGMSTSGSPSIVAQARRAPGGNATSAMPPPNRATVDRTGAWVNTRYVQVAVPASTGDRPGVPRRALTSDDFPLLVSPSTTTRGASSGGFLPARRPAVSGSSTRSQATLRSRHCHTADSNGSGDNGSGRAGSGSAGSGTGMVEEPTRRRGPPDVLALPHAAPRSGSPGHRAPS